MNTANIKLAGTQWDGRVKLPPEQKELIRKLKKWSRKALADRFQVSLRTINNILHPKKRKKVAIDYDKQKAINAVYKTRDKKKLIVKIYRGDTE